MVFIVAKYTSNGPVVQAGIAWDTDTAHCAIQQGIVVPKPFFVNLVVDTGATISSVSSECIQKLSLSARSQISLRTASNNPQEPRHCYHVNMYLSDANSVTSHKIIKVTEYFGANADIQGLLGWDVLQHCDITYTKSTGNFCLQF